MELRTLRYFLAVAREGSISAAAESLHLTQPTLSRQMMELEEELGHRLFERGGRPPREGRRGMALTEEGKFLLRRAQEIVELADRTAAEFRSAEEDIHGDISIGGGETQGMRLIARTARRLHERHPHIVFHLFSGNSRDVLDKLEREELDFGLVIEPGELAQYDFLRLPSKDVWGLLMPEGDSLASQASIRLDDLAGLPLIASRQGLHLELSGWAGEGLSRLGVIVTYNLLYNAALMVQEGIGYALCLESVVHVGGRGLSFRPLEPRLEVGHALVWKKNRPLSRAASAFMQTLREILSEEAGTAEKEDGK